MSYCLRRPGRQRRVRRCHSGGRPQPQSIPLPPFLLQFFIVTPLCRVTAQISAQVFHSRHISASLATGFGFFNHFTGTEEGPSVHTDRQADTEGPRVLRWPRFELSSSVMWFAFVSRRQTPDDKEATATSTSSTEENWLCCSPPALPWSSPRSQIHLACNERHLPWTGHTPRGLEPKSQHPNNHHRRRPRRHSP